MEKMVEIFKANKDKNFIQRVINPYIFPTINNPDNTYSTHRMAWAEQDGYFYAYPTIQQDSNGQLQQLSGEKAFNSALDSGEFIKFPSAKEAEWFTKNYKRMMPR